MIETGWLSLIPPILAISLALITKEVYSSLFIGVFSGMLIYALSSGGSVVSAVAMTFDMMCSKIADNAYMIIFLALLWGVVILVSKSGGSEAYGRWAGTKLKTRRSAVLATSLLGILIFIDDGFNSLTVGTVMRPITDRLRISREKLAYIIDATAAPVCIIAPVSSWAVAVASEVSDTGGFHIFLSTIPYNLYAIFTIGMVFFIGFTGRDFGPMKRAEEQAQTSGAEEGSSEHRTEGKGRIIDLVLPILVLIICAILGMAYVGGFFEGVSFSEAIGYNPTAGLTLGAFAGLLTAMLLYLPRKLMTAKEFINYIVEGISNIVPPMLILILSWTLGGVCRQLIGTGIFISGFVSTSNLPLGLLPVLIFIIAALMSFSMGTSWGTFGMLIPIVTMICSANGAEGFLSPTLGATLAGSVYGDHCSPISDTTILSSTGAECVHIRHVETQLPYATLVAVICGIGYLIVGFTHTPWIAVIIGVAMLIGSIFALNRLETKEEKWYTGCVFHRRS
ncbi:MAG: Na+/H+ antiporter NhaC family protein [Lachnospiraceae bacterium]|nr:Na+/H+ antiporter NhaC family protein [Lachnospiraceae bacterium]